MDNESNNTSSEQKIVDAWKQLQSIIDSTPLAELVEPMVKEMGLDPIDDLQTLREGVVDLQRHALLGHKPSIQMLVSIGCNIGRILATIASTTPQSKATKPIEEISRGGHENDKNCQQHLESKIELLTQQPLPLLQEAFNEIIKRLPPSECSYPFSSLIEDSKQGKEPADEQYIVYELCDRLIQKRLEKERGGILRSIAGESMGWPVCIPAIADGRDDDLKEYLSSIRLGRSFGIDLGTNPKTGRRRNLDPGTSYQLTLRLFSKLETERTKNWSASYRQILHEAEENNEGVTLEKKSQRPNFNSPSPPGLYLKSPWSVSNIWFRKAVLLTKISQENVNHWLDASMALIASECSGDYEKFLWPENILDRTINKDESIEVAAREILKRHLKHLATE